MYILETKDDITFRMVAEAHPANIPDKYKRVMEVANSTGAPNKTFAVFYDKSWEQLPTTKVYQYPRELVRKGE